MWQNIVEAANNRRSALDTQRTACLRCRSFHPGSTVPSIRDVVEAFGRREGVEAVIILGNDGLPIDSRTPPGTDPEALAALIPDVLRACDQLGSSSGVGGLEMGVLEYGGRAAVVANLSADAKLLVLASPRANIGPLLYDLKRYRAEIAGLL
jgi:predicted regulator of Ras-like GTPase activity (Roadblock/LC7/MglB family)